MNTFTCAFFSSLGGLTWTTNQVGTNSIIWSCQDFVFALLIKTVVVNVIK